MSCHFLVKAGHDVLGKGTAVSWALGWMVRCGGGECSVILWLVWPLMSLCLELWISQVSLSTFFPTLRDRMSRVDWGSSISLTPGQLGSDEIQKIWLWLNSFSWGQNRMIWNISKRLLFPSPTGSPRGFFSYFHYENLAEVKLTKYGTPPHSPKNTCVPGVLNSQFYPHWASRNSSIGWQFS